MGPRVPRLRTLLWRWATELVTGKPLQSRTDVRSALRQKFGLYFVKGTNPSLARLANYQIIRMAATRMLSHRKHPHTAVWEKEVVQHTIQPHWKQLSMRAVLSRILSRPPWSTHKRRNLPLPNRKGQQKKVISYSLNSQSQCQNYYYQLISYITSLNSMSKKWDSAKCRTNLCMGYITAMHSLHHY